MNNTFTLVNFNKNDIELVKILKENSLINCRNEIDVGYVSNSLKKCDIGFYFFDSVKPVAFICTSIFNSCELHVTILCSVKNTNKYRMRLINYVITYAKNNNYKEVTLERDDKLENYYKKFGFIIYHRDVCNLILMKINLS